MLGTGDSIAHTAFIKLKHVSKETSLKLYYSPQPISMELYQMHSLFFRGVYEH